MKLKPKDRALLEAIRDGKPYSKANDPIARMCQCNVVTVIERSPAGRIKACELTEWGKMVLNNQNGEEAKVN